LTAASYDVAVIGGGIHGAGVAQAVAAAGHRVVVLEQTNLAAGTSSRSSKLIHGGLRYLATGQFGLVRECLQERELLLKLAPDLVQLRAFNVPIYRSSQLSAFKLRAGLSLYAMLGGLHQHARFRQLQRREWEELDGLDTTELRAVYRYFDGQTDDVALTRAVMRSAQSLGAELLLPAQLHAAHVHHDGVVLDYTQDNAQHSLQARVVVNASGPWCNETLARFRPTLTPLPIRLVQGAHILVPGQLNAGIYYAPAPSDQRPVFVMPWNKTGHDAMIMVGTTEHVYQGDPSQVNVRDDERKYLLEVLARYFPFYRTSENARIAEAFAGLRVLPSAGANLNKQPRDTALHVDRSQKPRVLTIYGGKLTAYRATAEKVAARITSSLPTHEKIADTRQLRLT